MSAVIDIRPHADRLFDLMGGEPALDDGELTLADVISSAWEGLAARHEIGCPVCAGTMVPRYSAGSEPVGGRCRDCGSTLQ